MTSVKLCRCLHRLCDEVKESTDRKCQTDDSGFGDTVFVTGVAVIIEQSVTKTKVDKVIHHFITQASKKLKQTT